MEHPGDAVLDLRHKARRITGYAGWGGRPFHTIFDPLNERELEHLRASAEMQGDIEAHGR
jgi:hypothetical protein